MKITPISFNNIYRPLAKINNHNDYSQGVALREPLKCDTISFQGHPSDKTLLKKLLPYKIPDMYSGRIMIPNEDIQNILNRRIFSGPIKNVVKYLSNYEDSLFPVQMAVYNIIKTAAKKHPKKTIEEVLHELAPQHQVKLRALQQPIFEELSDTAKEMPEEDYNKFLSLMNYTQKTLNNMPVVIEFSPKEFKYKLSRIFQGIEERGDFSEQTVMRKLMKMANHFSAYSEEDAYQLAISKRKGRTVNKSRFTQNYRRKQADNLQQMDKVLVHSSLYNDKELNDLFVQTRFRIYKIPQIYPFKRKSFLYELHKITDQLEDQKLSHRMLKTALKLPTSRENLSAFIVKSIAYSSEKIGYDLISGSLGTIEHLSPAHKGGQDLLDNFGLASAFMNSERGHRPFEQQLKKYPETYENSQKYIDRLIELCNQGVFAKIGLSRSYIKNFATKVFNMSPRDNRLKLDLSKLKDSDKISTSA